MSKKLMYDFIKSEFEKRGYSLLSASYVNSKTKLKYMCKVGHNNYISWNNFNKGHGCKKCAVISNTIKRRKTKGYIVNLFNSKGYTVEVSNYKNTFDKLKSFCPNGHCYFVSLHNFEYGASCKECARLNKLGSGNPNWKGGVISKNLPLYDTYSAQLDKYNDITFKIISSVKVIEVKCTNSDCDVLFVPTIKQVRNRVNAINKSFMGDANFYCSEDCKKACSIYGQIKYPKGFKNYKNSRPLQGQWAKLVKERDNYMCQICGKKENIMIAHHIDPVSQNPIESADLDNGITLCKTCDKKVHQLPGCKTHELRCKK